VYLFLTPLLPWFAGPLRTYLTAEQVAFFVSVMLAIPMFGLLYAGLRLEHLCLPLNLEELNSFIAAQIKYGAMSEGQALRTFHFERLVNAERQREIRFHVPAPKRERFSFTPH
jgi:hypothetical protein